MKDGRQNVVVGFFSFSFFCWVGGGGTRGGWLRREKGRDRGLGKRVLVVVKVEEGKGEEEEGLRENKVRTWWLLLWEREETREVSKDKNPYDFFCMK